MLLKYGKGQVAELVNANNKTFLIQGRLIKKLGNKVESATMQEVSEALNKQKDQQNVQIDPKVFSLIQKELGDFEIII